tara:strand:+ start:940 stop:1218 length:279 start_codon:yes stop_codon:yes gene_type:complete
MRLVVGSNPTGPTKYEDKLSKNEIWEVWVTDGHYIKGKLAKKFKSKDAAVKYAKKNTDVKNIAESLNNSRTRKEFFLDDADGRPIGMIIKRP